MFEFCFKHYPFVLFEENWAKWTTSHYCTQQGKLNSHKEVQHQLCWNVTNCHVILKLRQLQYLLYVIILRSFPNRSNNCFLVNFAPSGNFNVQYVVKQWQYSKSFSLKARNGLEISNIFRLSTVPSFNRTYMYKTLSWPLWT